MKFKVASEETSDIVTNSEKLGLLSDVQFLLEQFLLII